MLVKTRNKKRIAVFFMTVVMMLTVFEYGGSIVSLAEEEQIEETDQKFFADNADCNGIYGNADSLWWRLRRA